MCVFVFPLGQRKFQLLFKSPPHGVVVASVQQPTVYAAAAGASAQVKAIAPTTPAPSPLRRLRNRRRSLVFCVSESVCVAMIGPLLVVMVATLLGQTPPRGSELRHPPHRTPVRKLRSSPV